MRERIERTNLGKKRGAGGHFFFVLAADDDHNKMQKSNNATTESHTESGRCITMFNAKPLHHVVGLLFPNTVGEGVADFSLSPPLLPSKGKGIRKEKKS